MAQHEQLPGLVQAHATAFGDSMNVLVLNAGVGTAGAIIDYPLHRATRTIDVNLTGALVLLQASLPLLRCGAESDARRGATVIGLSSITGLYSESGLAVYGATKAALASLLETVSLEEAAHGIRATAVSPGYVRTDMSAWITHQIPADSMIQVEDVVAVVDMLVNLGRTAKISQICIARSGTSGYEA
jgi:NAD(P)-dependent dehydrogenase (short-subunit alcohol dehydrogenase family)